MPVIHGVNPVTNEDLLISVIQGQQGSQGIPGPAGPAGAPGTSVVLVASETPTGTLNGINATFATQYTFVANSTRVFLNGLRQKPTSGYSESGTTAIVFSDAPMPGDEIMIDYQRP